MNDISGNGDGDDDYAVGGGGGELMGSIFVLQCSVTIKSKKKKFKLNEIYLNFI